MIGAGDPKTSNENGSMMKMLTSFSPSASRAAVAIGLALAVLIASLAPAQAADRADIDAEVNAALARLYAEVPGTRNLAESAAGILVFPKVIKAGFLLGVQGGHGSLRSQGAIKGYYETVAVSYGLQAGAQSFGYALIFLSEDDLGYIDRSDGFELGTAPSLVIADKGTAGTLSTTTAKKGILVFFFSQKGLMGGLGVQGTKITRIHPD